MSTLERRAMAYEDYLALPESLRAEWVDGEVVVTPSPSYRHQRVSLRLSLSLSEALGSLFVVEATSVHLPGNRQRIPDIVVVDREPDTPYIEHPPVLVVEILSSSTRIEDTVRKSSDYLTGGVGQYWIVDPERRSIEVLGNAGDQWTSVALVDASSPRATVPVAAHGSVDLDLQDLLRD